MRFNQDLSLTTYTIYGYQSGEIQVIFPHSENGQDSAPRKETITGSFLMTPDTIVQDWPPHSLQELQASHLDPIASIAPEVFLLGTGETLRFPDTAITAQLIQQGIGVEVMDTPAACRTYNILMHEGRNVAAGFFQ